MFERKITKAEFNKLLNDLGIYLFPKESGEHEEIYIVGKAGGILSDILKRLASLEYNLGNTGADINQSEITNLNVDDYVRQMKRRGIREIKWVNKKALDCLINFIKIHDATKRVKKKDKEVLFMGVHHYWD